LSGQIAQLELSVVFVDVQGSDAVVFEENPVFDCRCEDGLQLEVVFMGNRIELVIVAAGTADRQTHTQGTRRVDEVRERFDAVRILDLEQHVAVGTDRLKTRATLRLRIFGPQFVARDLFANKSVVRFVFVERFDDIVAVAPDV